MPKEEKKVNKGKIQLVPNVLYPGQSRFAYKTNNGSIFVISFKLKNVTPNTITYIVRLFLRISEKEIKFIKEFSFNSSYVKNDKIVKLIRQISNKKFRKCPNNYEEFNNEVSKEILGLESIKSTVNPPSIELIGVPAGSTAPQSGLTIQQNGIYYTTFNVPGTNTYEAYVSNNSFTIPTNVTIPQTIEDNNNFSYTVTSIGFNNTNGFQIGAFQSCQSLISIKLPYTITSISSGIIGSFGVSGVFAFCQNLTSVIFENGLNNEPPQITSIGDFAFYFCTGLPSITIPNFVTSIGDFAFYFCTGLPSITIPNSVKNLGQYAIAGCTSLTSVDLPSNNPEFTTINNQVFVNCTSLTTVTIPTSVTSILYATFAGCTALQTIIIPDSVTYIASNIFQGCTGLTNAILPNNPSFTTINQYTFEYCNNLNTITIYNCVNNISSNAFQGCTALQNSLNYGTLNTDSTSEDYVYNYFYPPGTNGFYVNIIPL
jgi:hypothetical protein